MRFRDVRDCLASASDALYTIELGKAEKPRPTYRWRIFSINEIDTLCRCSL